MRPLRASRRDVLAGLGLALAGGTFVARGASAAATAASADTAAATIVLRDHRHALPDAVIRRLAGNGARVIALAADPVRQWRSSEDAPLLAARATCLLGVTRWPEFLLVRGLAEESGRRVRQQQLDAGSGAIVWLIA